MIRNLTSLVFGANLGTDAALDPLCELRTAAQLGLDADVYSAATGRFHTWPRS